jgi:hypothetical protein
VQGAPSTEIYDPYDPRTVADPYATYRRLRDEHPVFHNRTHDFWALSRFDDVLRAAHDHDAFSNKHGITLDHDIEPPVPMLTNLDPPRHAQLRALVSWAFRPRRVAELTEDVRLVARTCLEEARSTERPDLAATLAGPLPTVIIADLLGVPASDRAAFRRWSDIANSANPNEPESLGEAFTAVVELGMYLAAAIGERRTAPRDDLISLLTSAEVDGTVLTDEEIVGFAFVLLVAGNETTAGLIGCTVLNLLAYPDQRRWLVEDPARIALSMDELVRFGGSVHGLTRTTAHPVTVLDQTIPEGAKVLLLYASANRDEREFNDPGVLDLTRIVKRHVAFGHGIHHCVGSWLARIETQVALEELLRVAPNYDLDLDAVEWARSALTRGPSYLPARLV